jgi:phospholipid/cholesterol/gamma-HCH transport system substrate-binding protein
MQLNCLGGRLPSQKQLKWSQLKVGLTVVVAAAVLMVLIILMSGTGGPFTRKILLRSYFSDAGGLAQGAPVKLSGVDIGNVKRIRVVENHPSAPVEVEMKVNTRYRFFLRKDSKTLLATAGVLGATYLNIDSSQATGPEAQDGDVLESREVAGYDDVIRAANSSLQNMDVLIKRLDRIVGFVESGQGSIGKLIYEEHLYNQLSATVTQLQSLVNDITQGNGTLGKFIENDDFYNRANAVLDKVNKIIDDVNAGNGTIGKFLKDPSFYDNANKAITNIKQLTDDINAGKGAIGRMAKDQQFADKLQNTMNRVSDLADQLDKGNGSVGLFLRDRAVYDNTNKLLTDTQDLIKAIRQNPKKYLTIHLKLF